MARRSAEPGGFATLEVLVAFLILSLALGVMIESIMLAGRNVARAHEEADAVHAAQTFLAEDLPRVLREAKGKPYETEGPGWRVAVGPLEGGKSFAISLSIANADRPAHPYTFLTFEPAPAAGRP